MNCCYIIFSKKLNRFYTGICTNDVGERVKKHNQGSYGLNRYTSKANDWELFLKIDCISNSHAIKIEKHIKDMKSSVYIRNLKKYPEMLQRLINNLL